MSLALIPRQQSIDQNGRPREDAVWQFFQAGTDTPIPTYTTPEYDVEHPLEGIESVNGAFPAVYINGAVYPTHKQVMLDADGLTIFSEDDIPTPINSVADILALSESLPIIASLDRTAREISNGVTPTNYAYRPGDVRRYGAAVAATAAANRAAIQAALDCNDWVLIPEAYTVDVELELSSNTVIEFTGAGSITLTTGVTTEYIFHGDGIENVEFLGAVIRGNGLAGISAVFLEDCANVLFDHCDIRKAGAIGILLRTCSRIVARDCELSENYFYGFEDKNGTNNSFTNCRFFKNGDTGVATSAGGRGGTLWMCTGCTVRNSRFIENTEYGYRIYSEVADPSPSHSNYAIDNFFQDNTVADFVLYDESQAGELVYGNIARGNRVVRTTAPTVGQSFILHGGDNSITDCHVFKEGTFGAFNAFYLYFAVGTKLIGCSAKNLANAIIFSDAEKCVIDGFVGDGVATACGVAGLSVSGNVVRNFKFTHGGAGVADVGIVTYNATGKNYVEDGELSGFAYGVYSQGEAVSLKGITTTGSTIAGWRKDADAQSTQELVGNSWDSAVPAFMQYLERPVSGGPATFRAAVDPASKTWAVGDRYIFTPAAIGSPKAKTCTTAGTAGAATWTSEGNL